MKTLLTYLAALAALAAPAAQAICGNPMEAGRWQNTTPGQGPYRMVVTMDECDAQAQTRSPYNLRAWVLQSSGNLYGRPKVQARYVIHQGRRWLWARVPTGGYEDHIYLRRDDQGGAPQLDVFVRHKSLDSKPDAVSRLRFTKL